MTESGITINNGLSKLVVGAEKEMTDALKIADSSKKRGTVFLVVITIIAVCVALLLGIYMSR